MEGEEKGEGEGKGEGESELEGDVAMWKCAW